MKCPSCGNTELQEHHHFCCNCGFNLAAAISSETRTLTNISPAKFTTTSDFQNSPEVSENRIDPPPGSSQPPAVTESVIGSEKSSNNEITKDVLSGPNNVNGPSNLNEIQAHQEQGAAPVDFPAEPGKFLVSDSNSAANEIVTHFPGTSNYANTGEAIEREVTEKILQPETSGGESETDTTVMTSTQTKDQNEVKTQHRNGFFEDYVEERGRNGKEILIPLSDGEKVNDLKQGEDQAKVQCPKEKKDDDDTLGERNIDAPCEADRVTEESLKSQEMEKKRRKSGGVEETVENPRGSKHDDRADR